MPGLIERALVRAQPLGDRNLNNSARTVDDANVRNTPQDPQIAVNPPRIEEPCVDNSNNCNVPVTFSIKKRRRTHVNTLSERLKETTWMMQYAETNGGKAVASKCVEKFPELFTGNTKENNEKASRWWKASSSIIELLSPNRRAGYFSLSSKRTRKRENLKAFSGRGRKRAEWV